VCCPPVGEGPYDGPMDITVEITPATAAPGSTVRAKVTLDNSPVIPGIGLPGVKITTKLNLTMSGGANGPVAPLVAPEMTTDIVVGQAPKVPTYEADIKVPSSADGLVTFNVVDIVTDTKVPGFPSPMQAVCSVTSGGANVASVTAEGGTNPSEPATLVANPDTVYRGAPAPLSGTNWTPGATPLAALCDKGVPENNVCSANDVTASTLSIDASGNLSGTATLGIGVTTGARFIQVSDGDKIAYAPVTVGDYVPTGPMEITTDISSGPVGSVVTLTGTNGPPNAWLYISEYDKDMNDLSDWLGYAQTDGLGNWTSQVPGRLRQDRVLSRPNRAARRATPARTRRSRSPWASSRPSRRRSCRATWRSARPAPGSTSGPRRSTARSRNSPPTSTRSPWSTRAAATSAGASPAP